jgi:hypothetical protein
MNLPCLVVCHLKYCSNPCHARTCGKDVRRFLIGGKRSGISLPAFVSETVRNVRSGHPHSVFSPGAAVLPDRFLFPVTTILVISKAMMNSQVISPREPFPVTAVLPATVYHPYPSETPGQREFPVPRPIDSLSRCVGFPREDLNLCFQCFAAG